MLSCRTIIFFRFNHYPVSFNTVRFQIENCLALQS
uniref:Uncharacterized protein n=1 Tax=Rhizophora mucronata TaxID=61149 RepID=A0A2P2NPA4_RHIMU